MLLGGIHEVIVKKLVNCTWQHLKLEAPEGTKARDCRNIRLAPSTAVEWVHGLFLFPLVLGKM